MYEKICVVCGKQYRYCSECKEFDPKETWRYAYCSENCRDIFNVLSRKTNPTEMLEKLSKYDLSVIKNKPMLKDLEALRKEAVSSSPVIVEETPVVEATPVVEVEEVPVIDEPAVEVENNVVETTLDNNVSSGRNRKRNKNKFFVNDELKTEE